MMVARVAVVVGLLLVMGRGLAWGQAVCPCFTVAQADRWLQLATLSGARLCACNPFVDPSRNISSVVVKEAPEGCDGSDQATTLALTVDSSLYLALPVCQVSTNGAEGLAGIPVQQRPLTSEQASACRAVLQTVCGG